MHVWSLPANVVVIAIDQKDSKPTRDALTMLLNVFEQAFDDKPGERTSQEVTEFNEVRMRAFDLLAGINKGTAQEFRG
jgi:hypothetical protein